MTKLEEFLAQEAAERHVKANHLLFKWLSDDVDRADLYGCLRVLYFAVCT